MAPFLISLNTLAIIAGAILILLVIGWYLFLKNKRFAQKTNLSKNPNKFLSKSN